MNFNFYLADIDVLCKYIAEYISNQDANGLTNIRKRYKAIVDSIPYNWYFCKGLFYEDIDCDVHGGYIEYDAIYYNLLTLQQRLVVSKEYSIIHTSCEFKNIKKIIIAEICKSKFSINIAVAWLSDNDICEALSLKSKESVSVKIIMVDCVTNRESSLVSDENIDIIFVPEFGRYSKNYMHNKFSVFDNSTVITGSYNWSTNANYNYENIVIIINQELAKDFIIQFNKLAIEAKNKI